MEKEFYKCPKSGNPRARNPRYKTPDTPKKDTTSNFGKSGYEDEDRTHSWGPESKF